MATGFTLMILLLGCFGSLSLSKLVKDEVDALQQITHTMGSTYWRFNDTTCQIEMVGLSTQPPLNSEGIIGCDCQFENQTCHVINITLKGYSLPGVLPPELVKLPYLQSIDLAYNYLSGTIPSQWALMQLKFISLLVNRLSGEIPRSLGDMTSLTYLSLEANQFSGNVPSELGNLINLETLILSSNRLAGPLPTKLAMLKNLTDFRINDNNLSGAIPHFIQNWKQLQRLEMHASGLEGPIPPEISYLSSMTELRISDINGTTQGFPVLSNMTSIVRLVMRNCNIVGEIPPYIWKMKNLQMLDVSFNKLVGEIPDDISTTYAKNLKFIFLTSNLLSGNVPAAILNDGWSIDLSYNNFTWQGPEQPACQENMNLNINLFRSSSTGNSLQRLLPCLKAVDCPQYRCSLHVNCGGDDLTVKDKEGTIVYEGDAAVEGGSATYFKNGKSLWGFSSTGDFMDDNDHQNIRFIAKLSSGQIPELYTTARLSPISLTYFSYCLENGNYTVLLHFAEIRFTNDNTSSSLGRRFFDIYIQDILVQKDFNIEDEAHGAQKPYTKQFNASVTNNSLEIRFYWAGKGTTRIPDRGVYGPLISAIAVQPNFKHCSDGAKKKIVYIIVALVGFFVILSVSYVLWWQYYLRDIRRKDKDLTGPKLQTGFYTLKQIKAATNNFNSANKLGEGGFGPVYKGLLPDGTFVAVKQLSCRSQQGSREFLNEVGMITCLQHPNLVKLHGCCTEGEQFSLVYEYMENNSLAHALLRPEESPMILDWPRRVKICIGIARGLAFLHEESNLKIVHRDIKATNVLLDRNLDPKISDFGLARLGEEEKTHISTRVAGTVGYMAPEYALWGYLTPKADVYSYGVVALEIVTGKSNNNYVPNDDYLCMLEWVCELQQRGNYVDLVDKRLGSKFNMEEAERLVKVALLCANGSPSLRPTMSDVVRMLEGQLAVPDDIPDTRTFSDDLRFKAMRDIFRHEQTESLSDIQTQNSAPARTDIGLSLASSHQPCVVNQVTKSL